MADEGEEREEGAGDPRLEILKQYTLKTMKQKADRWSKLLSQEEHQTMVMDFLDKGDSRVLVISASQQGQLTPSDVFPQSTKNKAVYFVKHRSEPVRRETFKSNVMFGDLSQLPLDHLTSLVEALLVPLIANSHNNGRWPGVVSRDVMGHVGRLKGDVFVFSGQVKGRTLLPVPPQADSLDSGTGADKTLQSGQLSERSLLHSVESVVIEWSHQIRDVLKKSSAQPLLDGRYPWPATEIDFWNARRSDLESVMDQLCCEKVQKMSRLLDRMRSSYYPAYCTMYDSVVAALHEARDISKHLKPLRRMFEEMEEGEYLELPHKFPPLFHVICLVWAHSTHYRQPARLVVLLQEASNLIFDLTHTFVTEEILRMEPEEGLERLQEASRVCRSYQVTVLDRSYEDEVFSEWTQGVDDIAERNLDKPLLLRHPRNLFISVHSDPQLVALLREVKYLQQREGTDHVIPESASSMFAENETYRKFLQSLDVTVALYNRVRETVTKEEFDLIEGQLQAIDVQLELAISELNWTSKGVREYIQKTRDMLERRVRQSKGNVEAMCTIMTGWFESPLSQHKGDKKDTLLNLEVGSSHVHTRYSQVRADGERILALVEENRELFRAERDSDV